MADELSTLSQIYSKGKENLDKINYRRAFPPDSLSQSSIIANRRYLDSLFFRTRFLDPAEADTGVTLFGTRLKTPIFCSAVSGLNQLSPTALKEIATGLKNAGSAMMLGVGAAAEIQEGAATGVPVIKIVKPFRKTEQIYEQLEAAEKAGCLAVGMDIDHSHGRLVAGKVDLNDVFAPQKSEDLKKMIQKTKLPFIIKGVLSVEDARRAVELGAAGVVVSNHGSASIDFSYPSLLALPEIVAAVGSKVTVLVDTGFKTGSDALKALALGAKAVGFASSIILAWGAAGEKGIESWANMVTAEIKRTMAATGCAGVPQVSRDILAEVPFMR